MSSESESVPASAASTSAKSLGRVKWFNNKTGYGFITRIEGDEIDVFVHHSSVVVGSQQYKYLVEGEYVQFVLTESTSEEHKHLATEVTGINGGKLMCETRNLNQESRRERESEEGAEGSTRPAGRGRRGGKGSQRLVDNDGNQWMMVRNGGRGGGRRGSAPKSEETPSAEDI